MGDPLFGRDMIQARTPDGRVITMPKALADRFTQLSQQGTSRSPATELGKADESKFREWAAAHRIPDNGDRADYDFRGLWKAQRAGDPRAVLAIDASTGRTHFPDAWATQEHPQFTGGADQQAPAPAARSPQPARAPTPPSPQQPAGRPAPQQPVVAQPPQPTPAPPTPAEYDTGRARWLPGAQPTVQQFVDRATHPYETRLTPEGERKFREWVATNRVPFNAGPQSDYDMRGFWLAMQNRDPRAITAVNPSDGRIHFPDTWKTPYHSTFSDESVYAQGNAPTRRNDVLIAPNGRVVADERPPIAPPVLGPGASRATVDAALSQYNAANAQRDRELANAIATPSINQPAVQPPPFASAPPSPSPYAWQLPHDPNGYSADAGGQ